MTTWRSVSLSGISAKPQYGAIAKGIDTPGGPLLVRQTDIVEGRLDWTSVPYCDLEADSIERYSLNRGDILISRLGNGVGNAVTVMEDRADAVFAGYLVRFQPNPAVADARFVGYQLQSQRWRDHVLSYRSGAAQPTLNAQQMGQFTFLLPSLEEQRAIAATLGALDDKIESNRRAVMLIANLLDAQSEAYGVGLPSVALGDLAVSIKDSVNPSKLADSVVDHFSLPAFDAGAQAERVPASTIMSNKLRVPRSAILLSRLNPRFNRTWWVSTQEEVVALASTEFLVLTAEDDLQLAAVWLAVRDSLFREELPKRVTGTSGSHQRIRPDDVLSIEVPDFSRVHEGVKEASLVLLRRADQLRVEMDRLSTLRGSLLPELLSGRIRVPIEDDAL